MKYICVYVKYGRVCVPILMQVLVWVCVCKCMRVQFDNLWQLNWALASRFPLDTTNQPFNYMGLCLYSAFMGFYMVEDSN